MAWWHERPTYFSPNDHTILTNVTIKANAQEFHFASAFVAIIKHSTP